MLWSAAGDFLRLYSGHAGAVKVLLPLGPSLWSGGDDATLRVWDTLAAAPRAAGAATPDAGAARGEEPRGGGVSPAAGDAAAAGVAVLTGHTDAVLGAVVLQGGELVWSCSADGTVRRGGGGGGVGVRCRERRARGGVRSCVRGPCARRTSACGACAWGRA